MFFEDDSGFFGVEFFFAEGAGGVAERNRLGDRAELPERAFALGVGVGVGPGADQRLFGGQAMLGGVLGVLGHLDGLYLGGDGSSDLSERGGSAEKEESDEGGFHDEGSCIRSVTVQAWGHGEGLYFSRFEVVTFVFAQGFADGEGGEFSLGQDRSRQR